MRSPLTGVIFTLELTHAWDALLPLVIASTGAYALSVLALKRSVLTEKIARRGLHLTREYSTDPLETFFVHEVMVPAMSNTADPAAAGAPPVRTADTLRAVAYQFAETGQGSAIVLDAHGAVAGHVAVQHLLSARLHDLTEEHHRARILVAGPRPLRRAGSRNRRR
jgi:hypothetical protein